MRWLVFALAVVLPSPVLAQEIDVQPYLMDATPTSIWVLWETTSGEESRVTFGPEGGATADATGTAAMSEGAYRVHEVQLTGLMPATAYVYTVHTGTASAGPFRFTTPSDDPEVSFRMIASSDMQRDSANPEVWGRVIHDGMLAFLDGDGPSPDEALAFVLLPGDLVDDGREHEQWIDQYFAPAADLMSVVPFYPVLGNHERNNHFYYDYMRLPRNGEPTEADRFWRMDRANVRVIGLDSNMGLFFGDQVGFLEAALTEACADAAIDFVFVAVHHANHSELWPAGETPFVASVVERVDTFSRECGRPSVLFYGHTHGYSRSASIDAPHLWINVASGGGNIDYWNEYDDQYDDPATQVSQDEWGFVVVDATAGDDPQLHIRRFSLGNEEMARENELRDEFVVRRHDTPPATPTPTMPRGVVRSECATLAASDFSDPDDDLHGASHWQVSTSCLDFADPVIDAYRAWENWYDGVDLAAGDDLTDEALTELSPDTFYCWRVRYRDRNLSWSEWTEPVAFRIGEGGAGIAEGCDDPTMLTMPEPVPDAGPGAEPTTMSGCGCRAGRGAPSRGALLLGLALVVRTIRTRTPSSRVRSAPPLR